MPTDSDRFLLDGIQIGQVRTAGNSDAKHPGDKLWTSAIWKDRQEGPVFVSELGLEGDAQADLKYHGGVDQAVLAYSADHYPGWRRELNLPELDHGAFGENFTVQGVDEGSVCLGDIWKTGDAVLQVTQPRQPCWKLSRRLNVPDMVERSRDSSRHGWYLRVLQAGLVESGTEITLVERLYPRWTVPYAYQVFRAAADDHVPAQELAALDVLSHRWQDGLRAKLRHR